MEPIIQLGNSFLAKFELFDNWVLNCGFFSQGSRSILQLESLLKMLLILRSQFQSSLRLK